MAIFTEPGADCQPKGKVAYSAYWLAVVRRDELAKLMAERQPVVGIARHYSVSPSCVRNALIILDRFQAEIASGNLEPVERAIWRNRIGYQKTASYLAVRRGIEANELPTLQSCGPKPGSRNKSKKKRNKVGQGSTSGSTPPVEVKSEGGKNLAFDVFG